MPGRANRGVGRAESRVLAIATGVCAVVLAAACTTDKPLPPPTAAPTRSATAETRLTVQYYGTNGFSGLVFVEPGGDVLGRTSKGQQACRLAAAPYAVLLAVAATITDADHATPAPGSDGAAGTPTLSTDVGSIGLDDRRAAPAVETVAELLTDLSAPPAARRVCT